jgi:anti-sigma factor RsiW
MITDHRSFEQLSEFADGDLAADVAVDVERHLATCGECTARLAQLRAVLEQAAALPAAVEPPGDAWPALRYRLRPRTAFVTLLARRTPQWGLRAAAALFLVAASSMLTVLALRERTPSPAKVVARGAVPAAAVPAAVQAVERSYAEAVEELEATLRAQRAALTPATVATLERTLRVIDTAIAEARAALAADPANSTLLEVLSATYEQKVHLLRRASELPART